ncbi:MAG: hypothetical protein ACQERD_11235 [Campylobacterota bacterium]
MLNKLFIVYAIDTEGPLHETLKATFQRLQDIFNLDIKPTKENLKKLQKKEIFLGGLENAVCKVVDPHLLDYNDTWNKIDFMLDKIMTEQYRKKFIDSRGKGIVYNWHCLDHVGFSTNERRRDIGFGNVFGHYKQKIKEHGSKDQIHWHFHPLSFNKEAHIPATSYDNSMNILHEIITRRVIEHNWFPVVNRAGFHTIRQDSSFFLEQWIPFDYSNQAEYDNLDYNYHDLESTRFGDWRRAPKTWKPYHPSFDDYQAEGAMNRVTTKCLNIGTRLRLLTDKEIEKAFELSCSEGKAILSFTNHDFRDMDIDIQDVYTRIFKIAKQFPKVEIYNCDAIEAMQYYLYNEDECFERKIKLGYKIKRENNSTQLIVNVLNGEVFGSQPYLAIKTLCGQFFHDNFDELQKGVSWSYFFDKMTLDIEAVEILKVASNDKYGNCDIIEIDLKNIGLKSC